MSRTANATPEVIRSTVLSMLADAHESQPATRERFRRIVSVRKLRDRLGGGDPATLGRSINAIESELVQAGLAEITLPGIPPDVAELMRTLWQTAVSAQLDDVLKLKAEAAKAVEDAQASIAEATLRNDVLKQEVADLRAQVATRDTELAQARTDRAAAAKELAALQATHEASLKQLEAAREQVSNLEKTHAESLAVVQQRYEGLSKQLLQETAQQRQALQQEQSRLASQLKFAERRIDTLEEALAQSEAEAATEREKRQAAVGEANALKAVNASQRAQLDELVRAALAPAPGPKRRAPGPTEKTATKRPAPRRKTRA